MKQIFLSFLLLASFSMNAQVLSGRIVEDNRKLISNTNFVMESNYNGHVVYEVAVNPEGFVTSSTLLEEKSTVLSTPANMEVKEFLKTIVFEKGNHFPKHHHANVKVMLVKTKTFKSIEIDLN